AAPARVARGAPGRERARPGLVVAGDRAGARSQQAGRPQEAWAAARSLAEERELMFERFATTARQAVVLAQEESDALGHDYIGTEHLLLGLLAAAETRAAGFLAAAGVTRESVLARLRLRAKPSHGRVDAEALATIGIDVEEVRRRVEESFGPGALLRTRTG